MNLYMYQVKSVNPNKPTLTRYMLADPITFQRSLNSASISNLSCNFYDGTSGKIWETLKANATIIHTFESLPTKADLMNLYPEEFI